MPKQKSGFTLIELLVVIVIIGILSGIGISTYLEQIEKARLAKSQFLAAQFQRQVLAEKALDNTDSVIGWYGFNKKQNSSPYILDESSLENNLSAITGTQSFSFSEDTGNNSANSLRLTQTRFWKNKSPLTASDTVTIAAWIKLDEAAIMSSYTIPIDIGQAGIAIRNNSAMFYINNSLGDSIRTPIKKNKWYYVIGSYNGKTLKLWIDGELKAKDDIDLTNLFLHNYIHFGDQYRNYDGWLDEVIVIPSAFDGVELEK